MTERIREICEEMKSGKSTCKGCEFTVCPALNSYADKILEIFDMKEIKMLKKTKTVEPSKTPWVIDYMGKQEAVIKDAEGRLALICPVHNVKLIVNAVNAYSDKEVK